MFKKNKGCQAGREAMTDLLQCCSCFLISHRTAASRCRENEWSQLGLGPDWALNTFKQSDPKNKHS